MIKDSVTEDYPLLDEINNGSFGNVRLAKDNKTGIIHAC